MPQRIDLDRITSYDDVVRAVVAELDAGRLIAVPDEVGVLVLGKPEQSAAGELMGQLMSQIPIGIPFVALADASSADDCVEASSTTFEKLSRRCWPGPVILQVGGEEPERLTKNWHETYVAWGLSKHGRALSVPGNSFCRVLLENGTSPALGLLIPGSDKLPEDVHGVSVAVESSEPRYPEGPTVAAVKDGQFEIVRSGAVSQRVLDRMNGEVYLFICTGNTCRSPMAEGLFRKMLAEQLKCQEDELLDRGYTVVSAGLSAYPGAPAAPEAIELLKEVGVDLSSHESQPVTEELLFHSDHILAMTRHHLEAIVSAFPELEGKARLLSHEMRDVPDPIGGGPEEYSRCRSEIESCLQELLSKQS
ncbi:Low molecular weight protein-tyrosine-phosphatase YwlE [Thalassoglobus neptunius]|uniref:protein-tyrosine-phosphatase n=1 Tax=Thalassoglobus neptunius TaxID=1938619 RepID=A0A5C5X3S5_9PLAN|nr:low molecular weight protein arginine phosphatase [Thalassoglobus neptunius]TWT56873.1 Low molecular weight protein-tyrosine-phosphatase YwlE [Thalassoglobus neptunius]